jgi:DNA-directed RNA polymerase subunit RPC12/RpoP
MRFSKLALPVGVAFGCALWCLVSIAHAAPSRTWVDKQGRSLTGSFEGVKNGIVSIKSGNRTLRVPYESLSERDQIYVRDEVEKSKSSPPAKSGQPKDEKAGNDPGPAKDPIATPSVSELVASIPAPTPELLEEPRPRTWTDLAGNQVEATFLGMDERRRVRLRSDRTTTTFPLTNFSSADLIYLRDLIREDVNREVFPDAPLTPLTAEQQNTGYRTWTDRRGRKLNALLDGFRNRYFVLRLTDGTFREVPKIGFAAADRDEAERILAARPKPVVPPIGPNGPESGSPRLPLPDPLVRRPDGSVGIDQSKVPQVRYRCQRCGFELSSQEFGQHLSLDCPRCSAGAGGAANTGPTFVYEYECLECRYKWTSDKHADRCPQCASRAAAQANQTIPQHRSGRGVGWAILSLVPITILVIGFLWRKLRD